MFGSGADNILLSKERVNVFLLLRVDMLVSLDMSRN
jgi:hypothetical protein